MKLPQLSLRRANWALGAFAALILVPVLYLLSLGPATALVSRGWISAQTFNAYAAPISLLQPDELSPWGHTLNDYMIWWLPSS